MSLATLCDDQTFFALHDLAAQRGRFFAGVDADGKPIYKSKRGPLSPATRAARLAHLRVTPPPGSRLQHRSGWERALRAAGVRNFRFHDLRPGCASDGATLLEIAEVLGHRQLSVTKRYSHLATGHKAKLVNRVGASSSDGCANPPGYFLPSGFAPCAIESLGSPSGERI